LPFGMGVVLHDLDPAVTTPSMPSSSESTLAHLNERQIPSASGGQWAPQSLRRSLASPRISGQRVHHGEIVATAVWPGIISAEDGAKIRALLANPERRTNKSARRYLLGGLLVCSHCGERLVARPRAGGQRRYACAKGPGFSGCGKTYINADEVERFLTEAVLYRLDSAELQRAMERESDRHPTRSAGGRRQRRHRPSLRSSRPPTGSAKSRWTSGRPRASRSSSG